MSGLPPTTRTVTPWSIPWAEGYAYPPGAITVASEAVPMLEEDELLIVA